ncbi:hypothetical protein ACFE04_018058 [Oxalis oulophora]
MGRSRSRSPSPSTSRSRPRPRPRSGSRSRSPNLLLILILLMMVSTCLSAPISSNSISVPFTASFLQYIDHSGVFLTSLNGTFKASISSIQQETQQFYFSIFHSSSTNTNTMVWTANRNQSISNSDKLSLTSTGLSIITTQSQSQSHSNQTIWSTPPISSPVTLMQLLDSGNLVLLDKQNITLWQSFDHPTDTLVINQPLLVRHSLDATATKDANLSVGDYSLLVTTGDAILQWNNITYWKLSMETSAFKDSNIPAHSLQLNHTGLYLLADDESTAVIQLIFHQSAYRIANLRYDGKFVITRFLNNTQTQDFSMPLDTCRIPSFCGKYGLCSNGACSCLPGFHINNNGDCVPTDASLTMPNACLSPQNQTQTSSPISYLRLGDGVDYFANSYSESVNYGVNLTSCQDLCMKNCSCLGMFYDGGSDSCYFILNYVGSFIQTTNSDPDRSGYIKVVIVSSPAFSQNDAFPRAGLILIPLFGFILVLAASILGFVYCRKKRLSRMCIVKLGSRNSFADELEIFSIAGLPRPDTDSSISSRSRGTSTRSVYFPLLALAMHEQRRYTEVADPRLQGRVTITEVEKLVRIALCCIHQEPGMRPSMSNVVSMLEGGMGLTEPLLEQLHHLSFYGQRFTEESTMGESGEQMDNKLALFPAESNNYNTTATSSLYTLSFISTDKLSGPR